MKSWIVVNHDRGEYSLHPVEIESTARDAIALEQRKGRNITFSVCSATAREAALKEARMAYENYHHVENALHFSET